LDQKLRHFYITGARRHRQSRRQSIDRLREHRQAARPGRRNSIPPISLRSFARAAAAAASAFLATWA
jgi:hypothetical protein